MSVDGRAASGPDGLARARPERALLLAADTGTAPWSVTESLDELEELARTAGADIVGRLSQRLEHPDPRTYFGRGKLIEARDLAVEQSADPDPHQRPQTRDRRHPRPSRRPAFGARATRAASHRPDRLHQCW